VKAEQEEDTGADQQDQQPRRAECGGRFAQGDPAIGRQRRDAQARCEGRCATYGLGAGLHGGGEPSSENLNPS
jgi:hypothetical protein